MVCDHCYTNYNNSYSYSYTVYTDTLNSALFSTFTTVLTAWSGFATGQYLEGWGWAGATGLASTSFSFFDPYWAVTQAQTQFDNYLTIIGSEFNNCINTCPY